MLLLLFSVNLNRNIFSTCAKFNNNSYTSLSYIQMWYKIAYYISTKTSSLALLRYGDGEFNIMHKINMIHNTQAIKIDKFHYNGSDTKLGFDLHMSLKEQCGKNFFYCIPFYEPLFSKLYNKIDQKIDYIYSANIFVNYNYRRTKELLYSVIHDEYKSIILFCNNHAKYTQFAEEIVYFPNEIVEYYERNRNSIIVKVRKIAQNYSHRLFIVAVGPLSEVLIWYMFNSNSNNRYIDFGSSIDEIVKHRRTRRYMNSSSKNSRLIDPYILKTNDNKISFRRYIS